ncbi:MAG: hypothetical protein JO314_02265, partial [Acidobacteria bacterium]|nr:hypothetical protein [Acidobacteriota bacterium]
MPNLFKFTFWIGTAMSILTLSGLVVAQNESVRKEVEALYAKRDKAVKDRDVAAFRATETKDFGVIQINGPDDDIKAQKAQAQTEEEIFPKDVTGFALTTTIRGIVPS